MSPGKMSKSSITLQCNLREMILIKNGWGWFFYVLFSPPPSPCIQSQQLHETYEVLDHSVNSNSLINNKHPFKISHPPTSLIFFQWIKQWKPNGVSLWLSGGSVEETLSNRGSVLGLQCSHWALQLSMENVVIAVDVVTELGWNASRTIYLCMCSCCVWVRMESLSMWVWK